MAVDIGSILIGGINSANQRYRNFNDLMLGKMQEERLGRYTDQEIRRSQFDIEQREAEEKRTLFEALNQELYGPDAQSIYESPVQTEFRYSPPVSTQGNRGFMPVTPRQVAPAGPTIGSSIIEEEHLRRNQPQEEETPSFFDRIGNAKLPNFLRGDARVNFWNLLTKPPEDFEPISTGGFGDTMVGKATTSDFRQPPSTALGNRLFTPVQSEDSYQPSVDRRYAPSHDSLIDPRAKGRLVPELAAVIDDIAETPEEANYLALTAIRESSGGNPAYFRRNETTDFVGPYQIGSAAASEYGLGLDERTDYRRSAEVALEMFRNGRRRLEGMTGRPPDIADVYMTHQQGIRGAGNLLEDPNRLATEARTESAIRGNYRGDIPLDDLTSGQFLDYSRDKYYEPLSGGEGTTSSLPSADPRAVAAPTPPGGSAFGGNTFMNALEDRGQLPDFTMGRGALPQVRVADTLSDNASLEEVRSAYLRNVADVRRRSQGDPVYASQSEALAGRALSQQDEVTQGARSIMLRTVNSALRTPFDGDVKPPIPLSEYEDSPNIHAKVSKSHAEILARGLDHVQKEYDSLSHGEKLALFLYPHLRKGFVGSGLGKMKELLNTSQYLTRDDQRELTARYGPLIDFDSNLGFIDDLEASQLLTYVNAIMGSFGQRPPEEQE